MNPLLEQFLSEARESLQGIGTNLLRLENEPDNVEILTVLFRLVHTLKGNSGLFDFPEMTRVLHAGEDLMDAVRSNAVAYSPQLADQLLDAMDFVGMLCDVVEVKGELDGTHAQVSARLADSLRQWIARQNLPLGEDSRTATTTIPGSSETGVAEDELAPLLGGIPESVRMEAFRAALRGESLFWVSYSPLEECFFQGDDPFYQARQTPGALWGGVRARGPWPELAQMDAYRCLLDFHVFTGAPAEELFEYYRYVLEQVRVIPVPHLSLILPQGDLNGGPVYDDFIADALMLLRGNNRQGLLLAAQSLLELSNPDLWISSALRWLVLVLTQAGDVSGEIIEALITSLSRLTLPVWEKAVPQTTAQHPQQDNLLAGVAPEVSIALAKIVAAQRTILALPDDVAWLGGRIKGVAATLSGCLKSIGRADVLPALDDATESAVTQGHSRPLLDWLDRTLPSERDKMAATCPGTAEDCTPEATAARQATGETGAPASPMPSSPEPEIKFGRRAEDALVGPKSLKVDQEKIDRLMNLIGEMVVAKNALPYLASRAESEYGVRELSREIKTQYAVINRIAEEMQGAIMQVRMMPVSFIFQRFPRLVRDISHRLGKEVQLVLEGEATEADKNIIEALGDPLVHIVRNSLDHGIELPETRRAMGKPASGTLTIRASQESDRVLIEIHDDGKGIDPAVIKRKAYEKGLIDEERLERISDHEAIHLIFAPGFSTVEEVSDLSGRGVGMDVVRSAVEKVNGTLHLASEKSKGTTLRLSLPLSMAITNVMIVESSGQMFGVPMNTVVETVRVPRHEIRTIKKSQATVLRGQIVPLKSLNSMLGLEAPPRANDAGELAVLVVSRGEESVGVLVDDFRESVDIILKPMTGVLAGLVAYAGSALLGDGSVLMVLNIKEII